jgi:hypothetical protein
MPKAMALNNTVNKIIGMATMILILAGEVKIFVRQVFRKSTILMLLTVVMVVKL